MKCNCRFILLFLFMSALLNAYADDTRTLAFPTAEGYGKYTVGGRGGKVIEVTNLNDNGPGSLREAINAGGPRIVVFRVSGNIELNSNLAIKNPYITIAGQTAPGDGICLKGGNLSISANQVIIRNIRIRVGDEKEGDYDALECRGPKNVIIDHVSASWSVDETMSVYGCDSITVQWCIISESMYYSHHVKGAHGFGGIWGSNYSTYHHNLFAHHSSRNPRIASNTGYMDYRNNVIYNWGYNSCYGGELHDPYNPSDTDCTFINMVNNYYKPGPATKPGNVTYRIANPSCRDVPTDYGKWYVTGNYMYGNEQVTANNWNGGVQASFDTKYMKTNEPWESMAINEQSAEGAYKLVLDQAGALFPKRDAIDSRIVNEVKGGYATYEGAQYKQYQSVPDASVKCGIIDSQEDVGGWCTLESQTPPTDTDHDGMPDDWEIKNGLNPNHPSDRNRMHTSGYTALEVYLNQLCGEEVEGEWEALPETPQGEDIYVYWRLGENDSFETYGSISGVAEVLSNMVLNRYTSPNAAAVWPAHTGWDASRKTQRLVIDGNEWPGDGDSYVADRYIQFGVTAQEGTKILVDSIVMYVCGCGTNGMQCNIYYADNLDFSNQVMIGDFSAKGALPNSNLQEVIGTPNKELASGQSLYVRIFPWTRGSMSGKTICVSDVTISGVLLEGTSGINSLYCKSTNAPTIYSITGIRLPHVTRGINIIKEADGKTRKVVVRQ